MKQKEKAKAYDKAIEKIKYVMEHGVSPTLSKEDLQDIFPKLFESEDEKIRGAIIDHLKDNNLTEWAAWLEKQAEKPKKISIWKHWKDGIAGNGEGKQIYLIKIGNVYSVSSCLGCECDYIELSELDKLMREEKQGKTAFEAIHEEKIDNSNKVEPKFKVGDWITNGNCKCQITFIDSRYWYSETGVLGNVESINNTYHLWTIADAKDGDVLVCCDNKPFIFKGFFGLNFPNCLAAYCGITLENQFRHCSGKTFWTNQDVKPATKEQCDLLFSKMKEAGYDWNEEKKELKRLEKQGEQKSKWTKEDDYNVHCCIAKIEHDIANVYPGRNKELIEWLKSLKPRMEQ